MTLELRVCCGRASVVGTPWPDLADLFTPAERAHSAAAKDRDGLAGRLAAKRAVAGVLGADHGDRGLLRRIQILPVPRHPCRDPRLCARGHPPAAVLEPVTSAGCGADLIWAGLIWIDVSVSHEAGQAFAASLAIVGRPVPGIAPEG